MGPRSIARRLFALGARPLAIVAFAALWLFLSQTLPVWHEGVSVYPAPARPVVSRPTATDPGPSYEPTCGRDDHFKIVTSEIRPRVSLCIAGRLYPLLVTGYASGVPYWISDLFWPLHQGRAFRLRAAGLVWGLLTILLAGRLAKRFADELTASAAVLCVATTPGVLLFHTILVHKDIVPCIALAAAILVLAGDPAVGRSRNPATTPSTIRLVAAAALVGAALLANLKAMLLIAGLVLFALRAGVRVSRVTPKQAAWASVAFLAAISPDIVAYGLGAEAPLSGEVTHRLNIVLHANPLLLLAQLPNVVVWWGDPFEFLRLVSANTSLPTFPGLVVAVPAFGYLLYSAGSYMWRGRGSVIAAGCGFVLVAFMLASALLYDEFPPGNYSPIGMVFGLGMAATIVDGSRWARERFGWRPDAVRKVALVVVMAAFTWSVVGKGSPTHYVTASFNADAERDLATYLLEDGQHDIPIFVMTYMLTGVPEALTGGAVRSVKAYMFIEDCIRRGSLDGTTDEELKRGDLCMKARLTRLLAAYPQRVRFLVPARSGVADGPLAGRLTDILGVVGREASRRVTVEASFSGRDTPPLLRLVRVEAASGSSGP